MKPVVLACLLILAGLVPVAAQAHGSGHHNLKVLPAHLGKQLEGGMKLLAKGLGVKCEACHVKGKWDRDDRPNKAAARRFLEAVLKETKEAKRKDALETLASAMKLERVKAEKDVWKAVAVLGTKSH